MDWVNLVTGRQLPQTLTLLLSFVAIAGLLKLMWTRRLNWLYGSGAVIALMFQAVFYWYVLFENRVCPIYPCGDWSAARSLLLTFTAVIYIWSLGKQWTPGHP